MAFQKLDVLGYFKTALLVQTYDVLTVCLKGLELFNLG